MVYVYNSDVNSIVGHLKPYYAVVTKNKNNILYCDIECFCTAENKAYFKEGTIIKVNGIHGGLFRIKNPTSKGTRLKARCYSLYEDAKNYTIQNLVLDNEPISTALEKVRNACDTEPILDFSTDLSDDITVTAAFSNTTLSSVLETLAELTGGFLKTDGIYISLLQSLGETLDKELRYAQNIKSFKKVEDWSNVCTKIMPIGYDGVMLDEVYIESETQYDRPYTKVVEFEQELVVDDSIPISSAVYNLALKNELRTFANAYLEEHAKPEISYEVEAHIDFDVDAGDTLPVIYQKLSVNTEMEVQEIKWDALARRYKSIKFGKISPTITGLYSDLTVKTSGNLSTEGVWHKLKLADGFIKYDSKNENYPEYKRVGNVVSVRGILSTESAIKSSNESITIATGIPKECRPSKNVRVVCQGSNTARWLCTLTTSGNVMLARYGTTGNETIEAGAWLPFDITYLI